MRTYQLVREQILPISLEEAWRFFSTPRNLERLTPDGMGFTILPPFNDEPMFEGQRISYIVRPLLGIPLKWETLIKHVDEPRSFTDQQVKGPFEFWVHTHKFESVEAGVNVRDELEYAIPFGFIGRIAHRLFVKDKIEQIFDFRVQTLNATFGK